MKSQSTCQKLDYILAGGNCFFPFLFYRVSQGDKKLLFNLIIRNRRKTGSLLRQWLFSSLKQFWNVKTSRFREYPCDHYTSVITVTLVITGCPRVDVQATALQLLQLLDKRFFGNVGLLQGEKEKGRSKASNFLSKRIFRVLNEILK